MLLKLNDTLLSLNIEEFTQNYPTVTFFKLKDLFCVKTRRKMKQKVSHTHTCTQIVRVDFPNSMCLCIAAGLIKKTSAEEGSLSLV